jgi:hypothetical protein
MNDGRGGETGNATDDSDSPDAASSSKAAQAAAEAAVLTGNSKRDLYQQALSLKEKHDE